MTRLVLLAQAIIALAASIAAAQAADEREAALIEDSVRARDLSMAVQVYQQDHDSLPPDLAALAPYLGASNDDVAARLLSRRDEPPARRADFGAWLNEHASFEYLGHPEAPFDEITDWDRTVIAHLRLDLAHPGEAGPGVPVAFLDGHVEVLPPETAAALIDESRQVYLALATGSPQPDHRQALWNLRRIAEALAAYARAHDGLLPPDLASAMEYIPDGKGASSPQEKARVFLSPRVARNTAIPEAPTAEWVRQHCAWEYLAAAPSADDPAAPLGLVEDAGSTILVHGRLADAAGRADDPRRLVPFASASGAVDYIERDLASWRIEQSRKVVEFARTRGAAPLPDLQHAMRDLRLLGRALTQYEQLAGGALPAQLTDLYDLVEDPNLPLTAGQRAAVFLSPRDERLALPPGSGTPPDLRQWLAERASYTLAPAPPGAPVGRFSVVLHQPLDQPLAIRTDGGELPVIVALDAAGNIRTLPAEGAAERIAGAR